MIKVEHLSRSYGDFVAVDDVSFAIDKGEIVGLLGHNGAGKTTIMKMISGYLEPSAGRIEIDGLDLARARKAVQRRIGYLPEILPIYPEMSVADYLDYAAWLKGLKGKAATREIRRAIEATEIGAKLLAPIATLSRGYKQRVGVAQAILGQPRILILDEPTNGLDPTQTQHMRELIRELSEEATVILSTHIMQEVDALCDRALIIRAGKLVLDARLEDLRLSNRIIVRSAMAPEEAEARLGALPGIDKVANVDGETNLLTLAADGDINAIADSVARTVIDAGHSLYELKREERDLETVFREVNQQREEEVRHAA